MCALKCRGSGQLHPVSSQVLTIFLFEKRFLLSFLCVPLCEYENTMLQKSILVFSCLAPCSCPGLLERRRRSIFNSLGEMIFIWELHFTWLTVNLQCNIFLKVPEDLKKWLNGYEFWLLFLRTWVWIPALMWWFTIICNCSYRESEVFFCPHRLYIHVMNRYTHRQNIHGYRITKYTLIATEYVLDKRKNNLTK